MSDPTSVGSFIDELVKVHLKQVDPEAVEDIEQSKALGWTEITFVAIVLALLCYIVADFVYPYIFPKKRKKPKVPSQGGVAVESAKKGGRRK
mmetsp:Transcript_36118/g.84647  ORF Transcript_36118/g.84647 Transcript_36118/m.84647 type:complete len:92 (+) Transcript_36118:94-369(+)